MKFYKKNGNTDKYIDSIFSVVNAAKADKDPSTINATAGCLYDEEGKLFTYKSVFANERNISDIKKASYASSPAGNPDYVKAIIEYVLDKRVTNNYDGVATIGGTGALYTAINMCLEDNDSIIYPEISWGNYKDMIKEANLKPYTYDPYSLNDLFNKMDEVEDKVFVLINSPCQNPLGCSYSYEQWQQIINKANNMNKEVILLCDIAYIDYGSNDPKKFFELFNSINENVLVLIAASTSKSFSYYGERLGALIMINSDKQVVDDLVNLATRMCRTTWSNASNGAMINIADMLNNHYDEYIKERDESIAMLKKRTELFKKQANDINLDYYPYEDGYFVTLRMKDNEIRNKIHQNMMDKHIYTIKVNKGIRVALCSVPLSKVDGLAKRMKDCYE